MTNESPQPQHAAPARRASPLWAKALLVLAAALMALGIFKGATASEPAKSSASAASAVGFGADTSGTSQATAASYTTSPIPFRLGFFFAALVGLQYAGLMEVKWIASGERFDHFHQWALSLVSSGETFVKGLLPSASASAVGLFTGWRRR